MARWDACAYQKLVHRDLSIGKTDGIKVFM